MIQVATNIYRINSEFASLQNSAIIFFFLSFVFLSCLSFPLCVHAHTLLLSTPCDNVNINININVGDESEGEEEREHESEVKEQFLGKLIRQFLN